jgi:hypothetical protein
MKRFALMLSVFGLWGCSLDGNSNPGQRCEGVDECPGGLTCHRGFCVGMGGCGTEGSVVECYGDTVAGCMLNSDGAFECEGRCAAGQRTCTGGSLSDCEGEVFPASTDGCTAPGATAADDNCNGQIDEECVCANSDTQDCYSGADGTAGVGLCQGGTQTCSGARYGACMGEVAPTTETCGNDGVDNDCDGVMDNVPMRGASCVGSDATCNMGIQTCVSGALVCVTPTPMAETCNALDDDCDEMVDEGFLLETDRDHCGVCGNVCAEGLECCGGACVDTQSVADHCSACGMDCAEGQECCGGGCLDVEADRLNCGGCGVECDDGWDCCDSSCVDSRADLLNCGRCGRACDGSNECCDGACALPASSACTGCAANCADMELTCCGVSCVDLGTDENNCGMCGESCTTGQVCCGGSCVDNDALNCGQDCNTCGSSDLCCGGSCVPDNAANCASCEMSCRGGETCCGDGCFDLQTDATRCGDCASDPCPSSQFCSSGHCCPSGQEWCDGACVNVATDDDHCGRCDNDCGSGVGCTCSGGSCSGLCV